MVTKQIIQDVFPNDDALVYVHGLAYEQLDEVHVERVDFGKMRNLHYIQHTHMWVHKSEF